MSNAKKFKVLLKRDAEDPSWFVVTVPALPEAVTQGQGIEEALANARECIEVCLEQRAADGETVPDNDHIQVEEIEVSIEAEPAA